MVTYHYVKLYVSIIIHLEVININVRNFNFPIGFYSNPHPIWTPQNMTLTPFTTKLKTLGPTRNIYSVLASARHFRPWQLIFESDEYFPYPIRHLNFQKIIKKMFVTIHFSSFAD